MPKEPGGDAPVRAPTSTLVPSIGLAVAALASASAMLKFAAETCAARHPWHARGVRYALVIATLLALVTWIVRRRKVANAWLHSAHLLRDMAYIACVVAILVRAFLVRAQIDAPLIADGDTWGYLNPALSWFGGGPLEHTYGRHLLYPAILTGLVHVTADYASVALVQHGLGLAGGLALLGAWHRLARLQPLAWASVVVHRLLGLGLLAVATSYVWAVQTEHMLRPEALYMFASASAVLALAACVEARFGARPAHLFRWSMTLVASSLIAYALRPQSALLVPVACLAVLICLRGSDLGWRHRVAAFLVPLVLFGALVEWPERRAARADPTAGRLLPGVLLSAHMPLIADVMREDLAGPTPPFERELLQDCLAAWDEVREQPAGSFARLGFDPQRVYYGRLHHALLVDGLPDDQRREFCFSYFTRAVAAHPLRYAEKVWGQLQVFLGPVPQAAIYKPNENVELPGAVRDSRAALLDRLPDGAGHEPTDRWLAQHDAEAETLFGLWPMKNTGQYGRWVEWLETSYTPLLLWGSVGALLLALFGRRGDRGLSLFHLGCAAMLLGALLTSAASFTLEIVRYAYSQHVLIVAVQAVAAWTVFRAALVVTARLIAVLPGARQPRPSTTGST